MAAPQGGKQRATHFRFDFFDPIVLERFGPDRAADVVDQDVEAAKGGHGRGHNTGAVLVAFQVSRQGQHARPFQFVHQLGAVNRNHLCALAQQAFAHTAADALSGAGDQRELLPTRSITQ